MIDIRSVRDIVRLFYIYRKPFFVALWVTAALMVVGAFLLPSRYDSQARLLVKAGRENLTVPVEVGERQAVAPFSTQRDPIVDEEKILTGRTVIRKVVQAHMKDLAAQPEDKGILAGLKSAMKSAGQAMQGAATSVLAAVGLMEPRSEEDRLVDLFEDKLTVSHGVGSNVIELRFSWGDPVVAQKVLRTWIQTYVDERTAVLGRSSLITFYETKAGDADRQISALKAQIRSALERINGVSAAERLSAITKRINEVRDRRAEAVTEHAALQRGVSYAKHQARSFGQEVVAEREVGLGPAWMAQNQQLAELKRQRVEALQVYKEQAPAVVSLDQSIAAMERQLQGLERNTQQSEKRVPSELGVLLARNEVEKSVRLQELTALLAGHDKELAQLLDTRRQVLDSEPELGRLEQALQVAEKSRLLYLDSLEKVRIDQALDHSRINNIAVVEDATFTPARAAPKRLLMILLALPVGALVGGLAIYLGLLTDRRIHDGGRIPERFGVPLWSTVKDIGSTGGDNEFHASLHRICGTLPMDQAKSSGLVLGLTSSRRGEGVSFLAQHLAQALQGQGVRVRHASDAAAAEAEPGEVVIVEAPDLLRNRDAFALLGRADQIVLVVEARASLVPTVDNTLEVLRTAFHRVDGVVLNRRRFEAPAHVLRFFRT